jgi:lipoprotein-anchoring transpeptidase ErfK/SrfK
VAATPVHVKLTNADNTTVGIGMPIIAYFSKRITSAAPLQQATTVTVNGTAAKGAWYFEPSAAFPGYPIEGHFRLQNFWPAHSTIHVGMPIKGLSAGTGLAYDDSLTLDFAIGKANIAVVDDAAHHLTLTSDGANVGTFPVSLGASNTRTRSGTKVIMEKGASICMRGPGYYECGVKYTQRLTYDGEYLHSAPWNISNIENGVDSSNGCTNLLPADAQKLYGILEIGDVVQYPNANGGKMQLGQGYGDWNVPWALWQTGGLVSTT